MKTFTLIHLEKSLVRLTGANVAAVFLANRIFHSKWIFHYSDSELSHVVTQWAGLISILPFAAVGRGLPLPTRVHWPPSETCLGHLFTSIQSQPLLTKMTSANRNSTANTIQQAVAGKIHEAPSPSNFHSGKQMFPRCFCKSGIAFSLARRSVGHQFWHNCRMWTK